MIRKFNVEKTRQIGRIDKALSFFYRKPECREDCLFGQVRNILIVDFALMGDMVMDIPFLRTIKRNCPNAAITMVGMTWSETILGDQGLVDNFVIFDGKNKLATPKSMVRHFPEIRRMLKRINQRKYEIGIEPKGDLRHTLFLHYAHCGRSVTYNYTGGDYLVTDSFSPRKETRHLIDEKLDLLEMLGMEVHEEDRIPTLKLSDAESLEVDKFKKENHLENRKVIGIHPGASNINKQYRFYPELLSGLSAELDEEIVFCVFEGPGEKDIVDKVCGKLNDLKISFVRVKRKTKEYVSLVSTCDYMICNDSAAGHIAAAYGIPTVVFFGPVAPETALPRGKCKILPVSHDLGCKPCTLPECPLGTEECIQSISVQEGIDKVKECFAW